MIEIDGKQQRRSADENASISIIVPVFNNAKSLEILFTQLAEFEIALVDKGLGLDLIFVDDGSNDSSYATLLDIKERRPNTKLIKLTRNFGAVRAARAGLRHAVGDALTILAADLQDSLEKLSEMIERWQEGAKFIICVRSERHDPLLSRAFAALYYRILSQLVIADYPKSGFDLMLMDKSILPNLLKSSPLVAPQLTAYWLGFSPTIISAKRPPRLHGRSSWTFSKRLKLFVDTITSFSVAPIRFLSAIGLITAFFSLVYGAYIFVSALSGNFEVAGFATLAVLISFFSGLILLMLGIIGEYMWRIFAALDDRPESVIEEIRF